jgi:hypothetical protein
VRRRLGLGTGAAVVVAYVAAAVLSGHLSPLARRPLLDGLIPPTPYRWVDPPPELASTNVEPASQTFEVALGERGSETAVLTTADAQVTLILPKNVFPAAPDQRAVSVRIEPLAASAVDEPDPPLLILGNVYRLEAAYRPSRDLAAFGGEARVVLVYPRIANDHGGHEILVSHDGRSWRGSETNDLPSIQQADAAIASLGYVTVGGRPPSPTASSAPGASSSTAATIGIVAGLLVLAVGTAVVLWPSRRRPTGATGSRPTRSRSSRRG